ncbi:MAG: peptide chain release factor N(5)-glutamine methyltransferase [Oscillospiraceae bacterium]|nr:peptide chain release factor N(5)-glutamine methyltransferase [Oscillospiraceae bacterium]
MTISTLKIELIERLSEMAANPALEAAELLGLAVGMTKEELVVEAREQVWPEKVRRARELCKRRLLGEPLAYILGQWEFCGLTFEVTPDTLVPRIDTEVLTNQAIEAVETSGKDMPKVLDLCCGSGCVGLTVAMKCSVVNLTLSDISAAALGVALRNAQKLGVNVSLLPHDMLQSRPPGLYDVVVCNPPYIPREDLLELDRTVRDYEPHLALDGGRDGLDFYRTLASYAAKLLTPYGMLLLECGLGQHEEIIALFPGWQAVAHKDTQGIERVIALRI